MTCIYMYAKSCAKPMEKSQCQGFGLTEFCSDLPVSNGRMNTPMPSKSKLQKSHLTASRIIGCLGELHEKPMFFPSNFEGCPPNFPSKFGKESGRRLYKYNWASTRHHPPPKFGNPTSQVQLGIWM